MQKFLLVILAFTFLFALNIKSCFAVDVSFSQKIIPLTTKEYVRLKEIYENAKRASKQTQEYKKIYVQIALISNTRLLLKGEHLGFEILPNKIVSSRTFFAAKPASVSAYYFKRPG